MKGFAAIIGLFILLSATQAQPLTVDKLRCEYRENPYGVEVSHPKLGWSLQSRQSGVLQTAYRILVSDDKLLLEKNIGNYWDSKKIATAKSQQVDYAGKALQLGFLDLGFEVGHARGAARTLQTAVDVQGNAAGIVATVFKALQAFDQDRGNVALGYSSDDAAHVGLQ